MRRLTALLLLLALTCVSAAAETAGERVLAGDWALVRVTVDGAEVPASALGLAMGLTLAEDGTAAAWRSDLEGTAQGTWVREADGVLVTIGDTERLTLGTDGLLRMEQEGVGMALRRLPAAVKAQAEADFAGAWTLTGLAVGGSYRDADAPGAIRLEIGGGEILFILPSDTEGAEPETETFAVRFDDGALVTEAEGMTIRTVLTDEGGLRFDMAIALESGALSAAYWFTRAEEE